MTKCGKDCGKRRLSSAAEASENVYMRERVNSVLKKKSVISQRAVHLTHVFPSFLAPVLHTT